MLRTLKINNLAIIDAVELELGEGLNVLTGETGAGKSILVSALELVLGGKGRADIVRSGAAAGEVEASFDLSADAAARARLEALGLGRPEALCVRRVVASNGRTRAFINGKLVTQQSLCQAVLGLADISSQHEHHTLSDPATHLGYLDAFAGAGELRRRVSRAYHALLQAEASAREFEARVRDRSAREALLEAQIREIEELAPEPGEDAELEVTCTRLRGMDALLSLTGEAAEVLYERDDSVVDAMARAGRQLARAAELDPRLSSLSTQLEGLRDQLEDIAREIVTHVGALRADPAELQRAEDRLHQLSKLKRRYGSSLEDVLAFLEKCRTELAELGDHAATSESLSVARERAFAEADGASRVLSDERRGAAERLSKAISHELESLGMGEARVQIELTPVSGGEGPVIGGARLSADGLERAEFLIAPNRGEEARSLHRVASGGELSRAMLAIKCVLADLGPAGMYVFDEVDAGVGGGMAEIIGRKIRSVARHRQVLCITHLAQIAVFADHHFKVEKQLHGGRTLSRVRPLTEREQREEIARMLGGIKITAKTRAVARELLLQARRFAA